MKKKNQGKAATRPESSAARPNHHELTGSSADAPNLEVPQKPKGKVRQAHEAYMTPPPLAQALVARIVPLVGQVDHVFEPGSGEGNIVEPCRRSFPSARIVAIDIRPEAKAPSLAAGADEFHVGDTVEYLRNLGQLPTGSLVIGNPPFRSEGHGPAGDLATKHIVEILERLAPNSHLVLLLPLTYLCGDDRLSRIWERAQFYGPSDAFMKSDFFGWFAVCPRPQFLDGGSANSEYCVCIWRKGYAGGAQMFRPLRWRPTRAGVKSARGFSPTQVTP